MIYFDHNATAPVIREAREAWLDATENISGNPSSPHQIGSRANSAMREAREKLHYAKPGEVIYALPEAPAANR